MSETLVGIADRCWSRRGGRSAGAADLAVYLADVRQRERAGLVRLERFVRGTVLSCTHPGTTARRRVLEALGEAGGLCTARMVEVSSGDVIFCTREAGHCAPDDLPGFKRGTSDGAPGGWHLAGGSIWSDAGAACTPHTPCPVAGGDVRVVSWVRRSAGDLEQRGRGPGCGAASGRGLSAVRVAGAVAEAAVRERETAEELRSPGPVERGLVALDPEELAERWAARHGEWWRVQALMAASGWGGVRAGVGRRRLGLGGGADGPAGAVHRRVCRVPGAVRGGGG